MLWRWLVLTAVVGPALGFEIQSTEVKLQTLRKWLRCGGGPEVEKTHCTNNEFERLLQLSQYEIGFLVDNTVRGKVESYDSSLGELDKWAEAQLILRKTLEAAATFDTNGVNLFWVDVKDVSKSGTLAFRKDAPPMCPDEDKAALDESDDELIVCRPVDAVLNNDVKATGYYHPVSCQKCWPMGTFLQDLGPRKSNSGIMLQGMAAELHNVPRIMLQSVSTQLTPNGRIGTGVVGRKLLVIVICDGKSGNSTTSDQWRQVLYEILDEDIAMMQVVILNGGDDFVEWVHEIDTDYRGFDFTMEYSKEKQFVKKAARLSKNKQFSVPRWWLKILLGPVDEHFGQLNEHADMPVWVWILVSVTCYLFLIGLAVLFDRWRRGRSKKEFEEESMGRTPRKSMVEMLAKY